MNQRLLVLAFCCLSGLSLGNGCVEVGAESDEEPVEIAERRLALTPVAAGTRPTIYAFTPAQRTTLANAILTFITEPVLTEHANGHDWHHPSVGELFFTRHHDYLNQLETFLRNNGFSQFVPVPMWSPGTSIPSEFLVADPLVTQTPMNPNPNRPIPPEFADNKLCAFATPSAFAVQVESWHDQVHGAVGGPMGSVPSAPGAPIFWLWHGLLDDMYHKYGWYCRTLPGVVAAVSNTSFL